jgi:hypothetical protein
MSFVLYI